MPYIHLKNNQIEFKFSFKQKFLFIRGDSGVGKTSLVALVDSYNINPEAVDCLGDKYLRVLHSEDELSRRGCIFFLDENSPILYNGDIANKFKSSDNYFVIINRSRNFDSLKTGLDSLVNMKMDEYGIHVVNMIYPRKEHIDCVGECIVCEDSKSGKQFVELVLGQKIESANSSKKFAVQLRKLAKNSYTLVYDRCGVSFSYEDQMKYLQTRKINVVSELDWDSFESYILEAPEYGYSVPWFPDKEINAIKMFRDVIDLSYDKSFLPMELKIPVYWKLKELKEVVDNKDLKNMEVL